MSGAYDLQVQSRSFSNVILTVGVVICVAIGVLWLNRELMRLFSVRNL